jgi:hypothetical protein
MSLSFSPNQTACLIILVSMVVQIGFAIGVFGPAWLSPLLTLPAIAAIGWLWRRAEARTASAEAFEALVI